MARKTITVETVKEMFNAQIAMATRDERARLCGMLEKVLHDTNNYRGFHWTMIGTSDRLPFEMARDIESGDDGYFSRYYY